MIKKNFLLIIFTFLFLNIKSLISMCYKHFDYNNAQEYMGGAWYSNSNAYKTLTASIIDKLDTDTQTKLYNLLETVDPTDSTKKSSINTSSQVIENYFQYLKKIEYFDLSPSEKLEYKKMLLSEDNFKKIFNNNIARSNKNLITKMINFSNKSSNNVDSQNLHKSIENFEEGINKSLENFKILYPVIKKFFNNQYFLDKNTGNFYENIIEFFKYLFEKSSENQNIKNPYEKTYQYISNTNKNGANFKEPQDTGKFGLGNIFNLINNSFEIEKEYKDTSENKVKKIICIKNECFLNDQQKKNLIIYIDAFLEIITDTDLVEELNNIFIKLNEIYKIYEERIKKITEIVNGSSIKDKLSTYNKSEFDKIERKYKKIKDILNNPSIAKNKSIDSIDINKDDLIFIDKIIKDFSDANFVEEKDDDDIVSHIFDDSNIKELYIQMREVFQNDKIFNGNLNWITGIDKKEKNYTLNINDAKKNNFQNYIVDFFELLKINTPLTSSESKLYNFICEFFKDLKLKDKIIQFYNALQINNDDNKEKLEFRKGFTLDTLSDLQFFKKDTAKVELLLEMFKTLNINNNNNENIKTIYNKIYDNVQNDNYKTYLNEEEKKQINSISFMKFNISKIKDVLRKDNLELLFKWNNLINKKNPNHTSFNNSGGPGLGTAVIGAAAAYGIYSNWDKIKSWFGLSSNKSKQRPVAKKSLTSNNLPMQAPSQRRRPSSSINEDDLLDEESIPKKPKSNLKKDASKKPAPAAKPKDDFDDFDDIY